MSESDTAAIRFDRVELRRGTRTIVRDGTLSVRQGQVTAVLGPSGAGKSTLLYAITGDLEPSAGRLEVLGETMPRPSHNALFALRRKMGVLLQGNGLLTDLSVFENVALPLRFHRDHSEDKLSDIVLGKLEAVGLREAAQLMPQELSGGMARRVALARALALDPPLMLYDEPLTGLDPIACGVILDLIRSLNDRLGMTSVVITHHVRETLEIADHAVVVANAGIVFEGTPDALSHSDDPLLRQFLDGRPDGPIAFDYVRQDRAAGAPA
ncbi:MAG: ATP-binding cassette domain-containing protein [Xanthomonadales bacterium]|nr:ATP-binding cassette domain-containing protein [Xanthomonadales bacterium]